MTVLNHEHTAIGKTDANKYGKVDCALCSKQKISRKVQSHYAVCRVALCTRKYDGFDTSCTHAWHAVDDLAAERKLHQDTLVQMRHRPRGRK